MNDSERNSLQEIIDKALAEMARDRGAPGPLDPDDVNIAELCRRTGLTRSRARTLGDKGFRVTTRNARCGTKAKSTVISGYGGVVNDFLSRGVTNSEVICVRICWLGHPLVFVLGTGVIRNRARGWHRSAPPPGLQLPLLAS